MCRREPIGAGDAIDLRDHVRSAKPRNSDARRGRTPLAERLMVYCYEIADSDPGNQSHCTIPLYWNRAGGSVGLCLAVRPM